MKTDVPLESLLLIQGIKVKMTEAEIDMARKIAQTMNDYDRRYHVREKRGENRTRSEEEGRHFTGQLGNLAVAKWLKAPPPEPKIGTFDPALILGCRVFTTDQRWDDGILLGRDEPKDRVVIKCHWPQGSDTVEIQGWAYAEEVIQPQHHWKGAPWREGGACYRLKRVHGINSLLNVLNITVEAP